MCVAFVEAFGGSVWLKSYVVCCALLCLWHRLLAQLVLAVLTNVAYASFSFSQW